MRISKGVSFNQDDPHEFMLLMFVMQKGAFSKYVKRLIQRDMEKSGDTNIFIKS